MQIKSGEIFAVINKKDGMVVFKDDPRKHDTPEVMQRIQQEITCVMDLHKLIKQKDDAIILNTNVSELFVFRFYIMNDNTIYFDHSLSKKRWATRTKSSTPASHFRGNCREGLARPQCSNQLVLCYSDPTE